MSESLTDYLFTYALACACVRAGARARVHVCVRVCASAIACAVFFPVCGRGPGLTLTLRGRSWQRECNEGQFSDFEKHNSDNKKKKNVY